MRLSVLPLCLLTFTTTLLSSSSSSSSSSSYSFDNTDSSDSPISIYDDDNDDGGAISDEELCNCLDVEFFETYIQEQDRTCYFYIFKQASVASYCSEIIESVVLETNEDACNVNIDDVLLSFEPECCLDTNFDGTFVDGIQITFSNDVDDGYSSSSSSSSDGFYPTDFISDSSDSSSSSDSVSLGDNSVIFSLCFNADYVGGTQHDASIEIHMGSNIFVCDISNVVPDLCGNVATTTTTSSSTAQATTTTTVTPTTTTAATTLSSTTAAATATTTTAPITTTTTTTPVSTTITPVSTTTTPVSTTTVPVSTTLTPITTTVTATTTATPITTATTTAPSGTATTVTTTTVCATDDAFNIAWLLDESGSVDNSSWKSAVEFVNRLHQNDLPPTSYSTLFEFASPQGFEHFLDWTPVEDPVGSGNRSAFIDPLLNNVYNDAGQTYTWEAVNRVLDEFWDYRYSCTDGCDTREDVLIVMTDGKSTDMVCPNITERLNQTDINVIVIAVGLTNTARNSISCLDVKDNGADILDVDSYDDIDLATLDLQIRNRVCTGSNPAGPSERPADGTQWVYEDGNVGLGPVPTGSGGGQGGGADTT